jgi:hypothetical protein
LSIQASATFLHSVKNFLNESPVMTLQVYAL